MIGGEEADIGISGERGGDEEFLTTNLKHVLNLR
jgi:hypothetical protein